MFDCGIDPDKDPSLTFNNILKRALNSGLIKSLFDINAVILSHAHTDHSGLLPALLKRLEEDPNKKSLPLFYAHRATIDLLELIFHNIRMFTHNIPYESNWSDMLLLGEGYLVEPNDGLIDWYLPELGTLRFYQNSHLLGAVMTEIQVNGKIIIYTGDFQIGETPTLPASEIPQTRPDLLILDGTNAVPLSSHIVSGWQEGQNQLWHLLDQLLSTQGKLLLPCFALGRSQDILSLILKYIQVKNFNNLYVYLDGQSKKVTQEIYPRFRNHLKKEYWDLYSSNNWRIKYPAKGIDKAEYWDNEFKDYPAVLIASSGMLLPGSASREWAETFIRKPNNDIVFTGYITEDKREEIASRGISKLNANNSSSQLHISGHASLDEIKKFIHHLSPKAVVIVHSEIQDDIDNGGNDSLYYWLKENDYPVVIGKEGVVFSFSG
jgi:Cft2 family RNA processing exonuclease